MKNPNASLQAAPTILLVESNITEQENFAHIALQQGWQLVICHSGIDAIHWFNKTNKADILVIEENSTPLNGYQTADYIKTELGLMLPVLITVGTVPTPQEFRVIAYAEGVIKKPFIKSTAILEINEILERLPEKSPAQTDCYSLNYLRDIFEGHEESVFESLKLFSTSVNTELEQLNIELQDKDFNRIREIAHSIKPSFEMLENETGRSICQLLNSEVVETKMPGLIHDLHLEFASIKKQLTRDFPDLKIGG
ncbi:Hpt domain-containing protein [Gillisia sp. Q332]|uniref:Hpt domain-containing protein n=1 Tax=Gillisia xinjiangensis TaxID=3384765 RepID=UPI00391AC117